MNNNPSINPANNNSLAGSLQFAFSKLMQQTDGMLPAKVIKYDRTENRVQVELLITLVSTNGSQIPRAQIASLPVLLLGGGGYFLSFPLSAGNLGWVMTNDRDISLFLQSYAQSPPNTNRVKSFSDGVFIPDIMTDYSIDAGDTSKFVIQSIDGLQKITLGSGNVNIESSIEVNVTSPVVNVDATTVNLSASSTTITSTISTIITPNLTVTGTVTAAGFIPVP